MKNNLIYYIMTYIMYLYPPFIFFMVMINFDRMTDETEWVVGIIINIIFVLSTTLVLYLLSKKGHIPKIEQDEKNHFIFGYIGNIVMFLYTYQYLMNIERLVSVFSLVLILVLAYKYLVSKKITFKEILLFSIIFGILDYFIIITTGNTLFNEEEPISNLESIIFQILFIAVILYSIYHYVLKLYKNHTWTVLRYIFSSFLILFILAMYIDDSQEEILATLLILAVFTWLIDLILKLIHKEFVVRDLVYYARIILLTVVLVYIREMEIYILPQFEVGQMGLLIGIFYVSAFSDVLMSLSPKKRLELDLHMSIESYIKILFKPLISRYKDVLVISDRSTLPHQLEKLGRDLMIRSTDQIMEKLNTDALSFMIIYSDDMNIIESVINQYPQLKACIISSHKMIHSKLVTCYTDFHDYVYTL
ncbi:MAG: hypothetical protein K9L02_03875 [Acholeplasmataceae bacterium]|nr:hypothetical protein [Acholeplasmataceae bacterium]